MKAHPKKGKHRFILSYSNKQLLGIEVSVFVLFIKERVLIVFTCGRELS